MIISSFDRLDQQHYIFQLDHISSNAIEIIELHVNNIIDRARYFPICRINISDSILLSLGMDIWSILGTIN